MRLLVATLETQGDDSTDVDTGVVPGEIVEPRVVCDLDLYNGELPCGCGRWFIGAGSHQTTTTAVIAELDLDRDQLAAIITGRNPDAEPDDVDGMLDQLTEYGQRFDVGTVVGIYRYALYERHVDAD